MGKNRSSRIALTSSIEGLTGMSARLNTEIANLEKEVSKNQGALDTATALRTKQLAEFNEEEKDMLQSITSLKSAVIALSKHHEAMLTTFSYVSSESRSMAS
jgi:predicted  nucleic acid-binding Zn-ribbon protein